MAKTPKTQSMSVYPASSVDEAIVSRTLSVIVDNEPGVLARVIGLFSGRGYNIDSLTVTETENEKHISRITIITQGTPMVIEQIKAQLERLVLFIVFTILPKKAARLSVNSRLSRSADVEKNALRLCAWRKSFVPVSLMLRQSTLYSR